jgi:hypothetical protein
VHGKEERRGYGTDLLNAIIYGKFSFEENLILKT